MRFIKVLRAKAMIKIHNTSQVLVTFLAHGKTSVNISSYFVSETIYEVAV